MRRLLALCALALLAACSAPRREAFTLAEQLAATVPGIPDARVWGDADPTTIRSLGMLPDQIAAARPGPLDYLALSSGGPAGAYGAGVLVGWGETGARPDFDVVTGVSSGALIAPFAFVGQEGDAALRALWSGGLAQGIGQERNYLGVLRGRGLIDPAPLRALVDQWVSDDLIAAIGREHRKGRRLLVMTTNLDAQRPMIWNLGAIAASGQPGAATLIRDLLVASASIPVAFPPVLIPTVAGDRTIREMHVDGGVSSQIFAFPDAVLAGEQPLDVPRSRRATLWLVVNYAIRPEFGVTGLGPVGLGSRAYGTLIKSDLRSELFAIQDTARASGVAMRTAAIPRSLPWDYREPFSPTFMGGLFEQGREQALAGTAFQQETDGPS